ncbi:zinc finger protein 131-like [Pollicipes pollicipes]|uniref:zinc finger protein 131-like n=1 Tax=Pollicipes pollicipes TaxID=41117 RepID=UPI001884C82C|nr:zinc finger protein 131-like [Pollicipes pollicipes]
MMDGQKFCLKWDGFQSSVTSLFDCLRHDGELVDITLCCEGQRVRAHRMMLSACSPYFRDLLKDNPCQQMVIFLKDTSAADLRAIIEFMYKGSVNVAQSQLASFIKTAEMLQIRGLSGDEEKPPPPAPAPLAVVAAAPRGLLREPVNAREARGEQEPDVIKVEKIDLTDEDEEGSLDAALGRLAEYEGAYSGETGPAADSHDLTVGNVGPFPGRFAGLPQLPGPSQRPGEDGSTPARPVSVCRECGRQYSNRQALTHHMKMHEGLTTCRLCGKVLCIVAHLRRHLQTAHQLAPEAVRQLVPTASKGRLPAHQLAPEAVRQLVPTASKGRLPAAGWQRQPDVLRAQQEAWRRRVEAAGQRQEEQQRRLYEAPGPGSARGVAAPAEAQGSGRLRPLGDAGAVVPTEAPEEQQRRAAVTE